MKKKYIAPDIQFSRNGSLESVFAASIGCGDVPTLRTIKSGGRPTMVSGDCVDNRGWSLDVDYTDNY